MLQSRSRHRTHTTTRRQAYRPRVEELENRSLLSAIVPGFSSNTLGPSDDGSSPAVSIGFTPTMAGQSFSQVFVNNNGNVTVGQALNFWSPINLATTNRFIFAPFDADVDTTAGGGVVVYGTGTVDGHAAFGVEWPDVGYYNRHTDKLDAFQMLLIDRSDTGPGNFDIEFNYDQVQWESGDFSGGSHGLGGQSAAVGFSAGTGADGTYFVMPGTLVPGSFLDSNTATGLIYNSHNSTVPGRYIFTIRNGSVTNNQPPTADAGGPYQIAEGQTLTLDASASSDPDNDPLTYAWTINGQANAATGVTPTLTWAQLQALGVDNGPGSFDVAVVVDDGQGHSVTSNVVQLTLANTAPTATLSNDGPVNEGSSVTVAFANAFDPSQADTNAGLHYAFAVGAGSLSGIGYADAGTSPSASFTFDDNGDYTVTARVIDQDGGYTEYTTEVHVDNVAPTADFTNGGPVDEGNLATVSFANAFDPSGADTAAGFTYSYDFNNDGVFDLVTTAPTATLPASLTDDGPATLTVVGRITDKDGGSTDYTTTIQVNNVAPTADFTSGGPVDEGSLATVSFANAFDPSAADTAAGFTYSYDFNNDGVFDLVTTAPTATLPASLTADGPATLTVVGRITDKDGGSTDYTTTVVVQNVAPTMETLTTSSPIQENDPLTITGTFYDPGLLDTHTVVLDWGDGGVGQPAPDTTTLTTAGPNPPGTTLTALGGGQWQFTASHTYLDESPAGTPFDLHVQVTDSDGGAGTADALVQVNDVSPVITSVATDAQTFGHAREGSLVALTAQFTDAGTLDTHHAVIDWGDGTTSTGAVTESGGQGSVLACHIYESGGIYPVTLALSDDDLATATASTQAIVSGVGLHNGVLQIIGTNGNDTVYVNQERGQVFVLASFVAGVYPRTFPVADVTQIFIELGSKNDRLTITGNVTVPVTVVPGDAGPNARQRSDAHGHDGGKDQAIGHGWLSGFDRHTTQGHDDDKSDSDDAGADPWGR
jgi:hypothetical protein